MAKNLNKSRMQHSRNIVLIVLAAVFFTGLFVQAESPLHELFDFTGYLLIAICALGRLYSTAFLGGHKNQTLITYGAFSVVRNPLYFFSLLGALGIALMSGHVVLMIVVPIAFLALYLSLIKREEGFLRETFGAEYIAYCEKTPRLFPSFKHYHAPDEIVVSPKYLNKAYADAIWWFAAYPLVELSEWIQASGIISPVIVLP